MIQNLNLIIRSLLAKFFRRITHREYHFQTISNCSLNKWEIDFEQQKERIKNHLSEVNKGISPNVKPHIFIACHHVNWEFNNLVEPWFELGEVEHYDWGENFNQYAPDWNIKKRQFCNELLEHIKTAHQKHPIDIFFSYLSGNWIYADVISEISKLGIITINISFDDTLKFWDQLTETGFTGNADIAPFFDICITCQNSADVAKYIYVGANPIFLPPAANPTNMVERNVTKDIIISFIGQNYGERARIIKKLKKDGIPVTVYGLGWPSGPISNEKMQEVFSRSQINLGFGFISDSEKIIGLKERDFEIPITGGFYITTYNSDLEKCYHIGSEIDCYKNYPELLKKIRYYINHPEEAKCIGINGRKRVLAEHTWKMRFSAIIELLYR